MTLFDAKASTTEEPDAGKLHVRVCAGGRRVTGVPTVRSSNKRYEKKYLMAEIPDEALQNIEVRATGRAVGYASGLPQTHSRQFGKMNTYSFPPSQPFNFGNPL